MLTIILALTTITCAVGWIFQRVGTIAIAYWLAQRNEIPPDDEMRVCIKYAWRKVLRIK